MNVYVARLSGLKVNLVCHFSLVADMIGSGIREFVSHGWFRSLWDLVGICTSESELIIT